QVLLVIGFGQVKFNTGANFSRNVRVTGLAQALLVLRFTGRGPLRFLRTGQINTGTVFGTDVVALAHALSGIVIFPEDDQQFFQTDVGRIIPDAHQFVVAG